MTQSIQIQPFNTKDASQAEYAALNEHTNLLRRERLPDDPAVPLEESIQGLQNIPSFYEIKMWCAWDAQHSEIIAHGNVVLPRTEENQHMAQFDIGVRQDHRRRDLRDRHRAKLRLLLAALRK